jgi:uncharacterized protein YutE (UPF0331/DUF86 family)
MSGNMSEQDNSSKNYKTYVYAISEQVEQHIQGLSELVDVLSKRPLSFNERNASVRSLQVLVEAAVGVSKHLLKKENQAVPTEARTSIERVYELLAISQPPIEAMRGAIGMRNAINHDYLNIDWGLVEQVLLNKKYMAIQAYIQCVSRQLLIL